MLNKEQTKLLARYFEAASNLYAIIPLTKLRSIYNTQNEPISEDDFLAFVDSIDEESVSYAICGEDEIYGENHEVRPMERVLVAEYICMCDFEDYDDMLEKQMGKPYYVPEKKQFLKYEDEWYFEKTPEYISFRAWIRNQPGFTRERADEAAEDIRFVVAFDNTDFDSIMEEAERMGITYANQQAEKEFISLCRDLAYNVRTQANRGHTDAELHHI